MKGMIFLDDNFKPVKLPTKVKDRSEFKDFIHKVYYIFFDIPERLKWFHTTYYKFDEMNSIFDKVLTGVYSYDEQDDYWHFEKDQDIIHKVTQAYIQNSRFPWEEDNEETS